jgi:hypothetical protein
MTNEKRGRFKVVPIDISRSDFQKYIFRPRPLKGLKLLSEGKIIVVFKHGNNFGLSGSVTIDT